MTEARVNESSDPALLLRRYERQIRELKQELAMRDTLRRGGGGRGGGWEVGAEAGAGDARHAEVRWGGLLCSQARWDGASPAAPAPRALPE